MAGWWSAVEQLERVMAEGWPALETEPLGGWLLRASYGFTSRGNSVLALGDPGMSTEAAAARTEAWYAARRLPAMFCLPTDALGAPLSHELDWRLDHGGYRQAHPTLTLTTTTAELAAAVAARPPARSRRGVQVVALPAPSPAWLVAFGRYREVPPALTGVAGQILSGSPEQVFLGVPADPRSPGGELVASARVSVHPEWIGIHAMWVHAHRRRQGLATALLGAAAAQAAGRPGVYLQVERDNGAALAAYRGVGFVEHHGHVYRLR